MTPQRNPKPTSAPMRVVTSSSPDPTTDPETTTPGPMLRSSPPMPVGAGRVRLPSVCVLMHSLSAFQEGVKKGP